MNNLVKKANKKELEKFILSTDDLIQINKICINNQNSELFKNKKIKKHVKNIIDNGFIYKKELFKLDDLSILDSFIQRLGFPCVLSHKKFKFIINKKNTKNIFVVEFVFKDKLSDKVIKLFDEDGINLTEYININKKDYVINFLYNDVNEEIYDIFNIITFGKKDNNILSYNKNNVDSQFSNNSI